MVTYLDSTNGTFINDKRLRPDVVAKVLPGSFLIFGKYHDFNSIILFTSFTLKKSTRTENIKEHYYKKVWYLSNVWKPLSN